MATSAPRPVSERTYSSSNLASAAGSLATVRERGHVRLEGKEYVVQDGEICHVRFNVAK